MGGFERAENPKDFIEKSLHDQVYLKLKTLQYLRYIRVHIFYFVL